MVVEGVGLTGNCTVVFLGKFGIYHSRVESVFVCLFFLREVFKTFQLLIIIIIMINMFYLLMVSLYFLYTKMVLVPASANDSIHV